MKKRIEWVDIAKFIGMFFVMLSHFEICPYYLRAFFTPFYLAIFFFCSGYCYRHENDIAYFLKKKIWQLIIPWFIYSNLNIVFSNIKSFKTHENSFRVEIFRNLLQIRYFDERLWFVPAMFTAYLVFYFVIRSYESDHDKKKILILCFVLSFFRKIYKAYMNPMFFPWQLINLPWHIDYIPTAMLFMVLGFLFKDGWEEIYDQDINWLKRVIIFAAYLFLVYFQHLNDYTFSLPVDFVYDNLRHIFALLTVVTVAKLIPPNRYMLYVGRNTMVYFCIHNKAITLIEAVFKMFLPGLYQVDFSGPLRSALFCFAMTLFVSIVLIIPCEFINRYMAWSIGRVDLKRSS
ncbi:MAG: acyltransferase family protein [Erysipelotrichaceae bacterium]|nr:acyltransferase family protein [Erysipelotrichaceae bacterium]